MKEFLVYGTYMECAASLLVEAKSEIEALDKFRKAHGKNMRPYKFHIEIHEFSSIPEQAQKYYRANKSFFQGFYRF